MKKMQKWGYVLAMLALIACVQCQCNGCKNKDAKCNDACCDSTCVEAATETPGAEAVPTDGEKAEYNEAELAAIPEMVAPVFTFENEQGPAGELFLKYINRNIKYPQAAIEKELEGTVIVSFLVDKDGKVTDVKVVKSVDPLLDEEAMKAVKDSPAWTPAKDAKGNAVAVRYNLPVVFNLQ